MTAGLCREPRIAIALTADCGTLDNPSVNRDNRIRSASAAKGQPVFPLVHLPAPYLTALPATLILLGEEIHHNDTRFF